MNRIEKILPTGPFLNPDSVAIVGASDDRRKYGGRILPLLLKHGYKGQIFPVNPHADSLLGLKTYRNIASIPATPSLAVITTPKSSIIKIIEECGEKGIKAAIIIASQFAEVGDAGKQDQDRLIQTARRHRVRILGPNCLGLFSPLNGLILTSANALDVERLTKGSIAMVSQSGALMISAFDRAQRYGTGFSGCVSLGNQADLEAADFIEHFLHDEDTRVVCSYLEGFKDPQRILRLGELAREKGKPWLMVKGGRTQAGEKAAFSHTASLMADYAVLSAAMEREGILLMDDVDAMVMLADGLTRSHQHNLHHVAVMTASGGLGAIAADRLSSAGISLAELSPEAKMHLERHFLPGQNNNPIDLGARIESDVTNAATAALECIESDPEISLTLFVLATSPNFLDFVKGLLSAVSVCSKPYIFILTPGRAADPIRELLAGRDIPYCDRIDEAVRVLQGWRDWTALVAAPQKPPIRPRNLPSPPLPTPERQSLLRLGELETKALVAEYGIAVNAGRLTRDKSEAIAVAKELGFPLVLKVASAQVAHKSDLGGVMLNIADEEQLTRAWDEVVDSLARRAPEAKIDGIVIQTMMSGACELILGLKYDRDFGPLVLVGSGGIFTEVFRDVQLTLAPIEVGQATAMLRRLKIWPVLGPFRGRPALDITAAAEAISRLSWLGWDLGPRLMELDINPLLVRTIGEGVVAVDGRAVIYGSV